MPVTPLSNVLQYPKPDDEEARLPPIDIELSQPGDEISFEDGAKKTELPGGAVEIDLSGGKTRSGPKSDKFNANLAEDMEEAELSRIASDLLEGIDRDNQSRSEHLDMIAEGMKLLGLVIESNNASTASSSAPLEGMSTVRHPLLLEACQLFQANAMGELLPAAGPVKVRDDRPQKPQGMMGHNGGPPLDAPNPFTAPSPEPAASSTQPGLGAPGAGAPPPASAGVLPASPMPAVADSGQAGGMPAAPMQALPLAPPEPIEHPRDELANALEKDFNHYLTATAKEYVPDTDQMLFKVGFGGLGIKKVYNCPLRRRPVSESVDIEDFIVSNALTDLSNAGRITHRIKMRPSTLKRMQLLKVYRDVPIGQPTAAAESPNAIDTAKADIAGVQPQVSDPRDADHELFECYCELSLDEFAPAQFKGKELPLPYKVTIEKESQKVLEIRRNWKEDDKECLAKEYFVDFPYMRAFGFYCIGLLHLLGNTTKALTALWREFIDAGMFANFPGFLYLKGAGRQLTNQFRVAPGTGVGLDANVNDIRQAVMALPYKNPDAGFVQFVSHVEELGQRLGGTANQPTAEGRADAPVGTTLALIEQASKPIGAVNKRLHNAQAREFALLKERFIDDPEAFWRFNKRPTMQWQKDQFIAALEDYDLVPVSDPNNPTRLHRQAKAEAYKGIVDKAPALFNLKKAILKYSTDMEITGVEETMIPGDAPPPQAPPVDPAKMADVQHKNEKAQLDATTKANSDQNALRIKEMELTNNREERANDLRIAEVEQGTERLRLAGTIAIHASNADEAQRALSMKILGETVAKAHGQVHEMDKLEVTQAHQSRQGELGHERAKDMAEHAANLAPPASEAAE
jgi:hypothetical protein